MRNIDARKRNRGGSILGTEIGDLRSGAPPTNFQKGVVVDVLSDPSLRDRSDSPFAQLRVTNPQYLQIAPRNSIVVKLIGGGQAKQDDTSVVCFPFFPPHLCMPINAGETVWIVSDSGVGDNPLLYWMSRVPEPISVDDINYTHSDRRFESPEPRRLSDRVRQQETNPPELSFPNGAGTDDGGTLSGDNGAYDQLVSRSVAYSNSVKEAVPRYTKRPGDLVLQGTNNTLISLGTDRKSDSGDATGVASSAMVQTESGSSMQTELLGAGTIDIVAGRGQGTSASAPPTVTNTRNFEEVDKRPSAATNPQEGDPDYTTDLSRVYVSMRTDGDTNFGLEPVGGESQVNDSPFVVAKSDNIRLVGRDTVRLIAEGDNQATVQMVDGKIRIQAGPSYVEIDGDDVSIEAPGNVSVKSGNDFSVSSDNKADVTGLQSASLASNESVTVAGSSVSIIGPTGVTISGPLSVSAIAPSIPGASLTLGDSESTVTLSGVNVVEALGIIATALSTAAPTTGLNPSGVALANLLARAAAS
jgi:hypothetical protein